MLNINISIPSDTSEVKGIDSACKHVVGQRRKQAAMR